MGTSGNSISPSLPPPGRYVSPWYAGRVTRWELASTVSRSGVERSIRVYLGLERRGAQVTALSGPDR